MTSRNATLVVCDSQSTAGSTDKYTLLPQIIISTVKGFQEYLANLPTFAIIILLFFTSSDRIFDPILEESKKKKDQIVRVFVCSNPIDRFINDQANVFHISKHLIQYKINTSFCKFLALESQKQFDKGNIKVGEALEQQRIDLANWLPLNDPVKACHIIIIPLNTGDQNLYDAKRRLQKFCNDSFGGEYNFRVYTLYDYIPPEESDPDPDNPSYTRFFEYKHRGDICNLIQRLSIIRLYLVGNEPDITNKWSKRLIASELDVNHAQASQYEDRCTFIENQLVVTPIQDLAQRCGRTWQMSSIKPRKIRDLRDDLVFGETVQRIHGCLENREMAANVELRQRISESTEDITTFSSRIHSIKQAENGPEEKEETAELFNKILPI